MLIKNFDFLDDKDKQDFLKDGFIIKKTNKPELLNEFREQVVSWFCEASEMDKNDDTEIFLNNIHKKISDGLINDIRMYIYNQLNAQSWSRPTFFSLARDVIEKIVGNELVMQNKVNASIMMPNDGGSNIPLHIDAHSGESPFQTVLWLPLTDVYETKGMFIVSPETNDYANKHFKSWVNKGGKEMVLNEIKDELIWLKIPFGSYILFSSNLFHGSTVNETCETRWSFNCRFKSLFSPYTSDEKGFGSFYLPINTNPITKFGLKYQPPSGFNNERK